MAFDANQRGVIAHVIPAWLVTAAVAALCIVTGWRPWSFGTDVAGRLAYAAACVLPPALMLVVAVGRVANYRFASPLDIDGSGGTTESPRVRVLRALLQNTLEQTVLTMPTYLGAAILLPERWLGCVAAAASLVVIGRILFFRGYAGGAPGRALGFGLTFYPTLALLLAALVRVVQSG